jgi:hypothetical protein
VVAPAGWMDAPAKRIPRICFLLDTVYRCSAAVPENHFCTLKHDVLH